MIQLPLDYSDVPQIHRIAGGGHGEDAPVAIEAQGVYRARVRRVQRGQYFAGVCVGQAQSAPANGEGHQSAVRRERHVARQAGGVVGRQIPRHRPGRAVVKAHARRVARHQHTAIGTELDAAVAGMGVEQAYEAPGVQFPQARAAASFARRHHPATVGAERGSARFRFTHESRDATGIVQMKHHHFAAADLGPG